MPFNRNKLESDAREITAAVERGDLLTASDVARATGISKETIRVHISRKKLKAVHVGIDVYVFPEDMAAAYTEEAGDGLIAYRLGSWKEWWEQNRRVSRGR